MLKPPLEKRSHVHFLLLRITLSILGVLLVACLPAAAQSSWDLFAGFSYVRSETTPLAEPIGLDHINAYGWGVGFTQYSPWPWLGVSVDISGSYNNPGVHIPADSISPGVPETNMNVDNLIHTTTYTGMVGPTFAYRGNHNIEPFAHAMLGMVGRVVGLTSKGQILAGTPLDSSEWVLGYALGGGADFKITKLLAIRGQVDWVRSTFADAEDDHQNNIRVLGGLVFRLGE
jgi:opacity protein-like surface antigen